MSPNHFLVLATVIFFMGFFGMLVRKNVFFMLMSIELMLNAANLVWVAFARVMGNLDGQVFAFFIMAIAASEACVGLAIVVVFFRSRRSVDIEQAALMKN